MSDSQTKTEKLQKVLARLGMGSRRELEIWIEAGRVSINGTRAKLGERVSERDIIRVDGRRVGRATRGGRYETRAPRPRVLAYHKPAGEVATRRDPEGRPTIYQALPRLTMGRWIAVGRLDINTTGLLLLTTDGDLAHRLMHPSTGVAREYAVRVFGQVSREVLERLRTGVQLDDGWARFETLEDAGGEGMNHWYRATLKEGRNREVRRLWESQGVRVSRLIRTGYASVSLPRRLRPGRWEELRADELAMLREAAGLRTDGPGAKRREHRAEGREQGEERRGKRAASGRRSAGRKQEAENREQAAGEGKRGRSAVSGRRAAVSGQKTEGGKSRPATRGKREGGIGEGSARKERPAGGGRKAGSGDQGAGSRRREKRAESGQRAAGGKQEAGSRERSAGGGQRPAGRKSEAGAGVGGRKEKRTGRKR